MDRLVPLPGGDHYRPVEGTCPDNFSCSSPSIEVDKPESAQPYTDEDGVWCTSAPNTMLMDYEIVITDADGQETASYPAPVTCIVE